MTLRGIFALAFELFLLIMTLGTDIREFLIVAACVGGLILYSLISLLFAVIGFSCKSKIDSAEIFRGETVKYTLKIYGPAIFPVVGKLAVKPADNGDISDKKSLRKSFLLVPDFKLGRQYNFEFLCAHTGLWKIGIEKFRINDIFGFFSLPLLRTGKKRLLTEIAVLPVARNLNDDGNYIDISKGFGGNAIRNSEMGELLSDSRYYREGDAMRRINWKQSIRTGKLFTRQYEMPEVPNVLIAIDSACYTDTTGAITDVYRETAVSIANAYVSQGVAVNLITLRNKGIDGGINEYYRDEREINNLQYELIEKVFVKDRSPLEIPRLDDSSFLNADKIYIITANPSEGLLSAVNDSIKSGKSAYCIVAGMADMLPAQLNTVIENTGADPVIINGIDEIEVKAGELF